MPSRYADALKIQRDFLLTYLSRRQVFWVVAAAAAVTLASAAAGGAWGAVGAAAVGAGAAVVALGVVISIYAAQSYWGIQQLRHESAVEAAAGVEGIWRGASPPYSANPDLLSALLRHVRERKPRLVVELGAGLSTVVMASALKQNGGGQLVSVEHWRDYGDHVRQQIAEHGLEEYATVLHAELVTRADGRIWYDIDPASIPGGEIDMLVVDGPPNLLFPRIREPALDVFAPRLADGALVLLDDAKRWDERGILASWTRRYPGASVRIEASERGVGVLEWRA